MFLYTDSFKRETILKKNLRKKKEFKKKKKLYIYINIYSFKKHISIFRCKPNPLPLFAKFSALQLYWGHFSERSILHDTQDFPMI